MRHEWWRADSSRASADPLLIAGTTNTHTHTDDGRDICRLFLCAVRLLIRIGKPLHPKIALLELRRKR